MTRLGYAGSPEAVLRLRDRARAGWLVVKPCRYRRGWIVWMREAS